MKYDYEGLKSRYSGFVSPAIRVCVEGEDFSDAPETMIIPEAEISLSSGFEASQAVFSIYGCIDRAGQKYLFDEMKSYILLGSGISISLGYVSADTEVFRGFISYVRFVGEADEQPHIEVTALDVKGAMMAGRSEKQLKASSYGAAVKELFKMQTYQWVREKGMMDRLSVSDTPDAKNGKKSGIGLIEMTGESDYEFVVRAAREYGYEFFSDVGTVYFRKARDGAQELIGVEPGKGLISYDIGYDIGGIVKEVEVRGTDKKTGELISGIKKCGGTFSHGNRAGAVTEYKKAVYTDAAVETQEDARVKAEAAMDVQTWKYGRMQCECIGLPELKAGVYVEIAGMGTGPDNRFYITKAEHVLSGENGYRTKLTGYTASAGQG